MHHILGRLRNLHFVGKAAVCLSVGLISIATLGACEGPEELSQFPTSGTIFDDNVEVYAHSDWVDVTPAPVVAIPNDRLTITCTGRITPFTDVFGGGPGERDATGG